MKLNKNGMTLFELLAVIVILGIIAAIAFPTVNGIIANTKKDSFTQNTNLFVQAAVTEAKGDYTANGYTTEESYEFYIGTKPATATIDAIELTDVKHSGVDAYITMTITNGEITSYTVTYASNLYGVTDSDTNKATIDSAPSFSRKDVKETLKLTS